ncbi:hypothetical protein [Oxynema aestuarii]|uniref:Holin n=1 Tax=Oxynema aestuarii AP17 TaxID=2064643 RepID=A0A6H1U2K6_9CYAN|nr:hypothetical protein [Oxynema aestuarii]QIZ72263.1 hypothetical protein HCG48_18175 [Oxynema aestuarii AP17]
MSNVVKAAGSAVTVAGSAAAAGVTWPVVAAFGIGTLGVLGLAAIVSGRDMEANYENGDTKIGIKIF